MAFPEQNWQWVWNGSTWGNTMSRNIFIAVSENTSTWDHRQKHHPARGQQSPHRFLLMSTFYINRKLSFFPSCLESLPHNGAYWCIITSACDLSPIHRKSQEHLEGLRFLPCITVATEMSLFHQRLCTRWKVSHEMWGCVCLVPLNL